MMAAHRTTALLLATGILLTIPRAVLCQTNGNEPSGAIVGQVRFESGLAAPAGIVVRLEGRESGTSTETVSDASGHFQFSELPPGEYVATVSSREYQTSSQTVEVQSAGRVPVVLDVRPATNDSNLAGAGQPTVSVAQLSIPEKARKEYSKGVELLNEKHEPAKSVAHFHRALQRYPQFAAAALFLGIAQLQLHDWDEAQANLEKALQFQHDLTPAYLALGALFNEQGKYAQAQPLLAQALGLDSSSAMIQYEMGRAYWGLKRWREAEDHTTNALSIRPDLPEAHVLMGNLLLRQGEASQAAAQFRDYLRLAPAGAMAAAAQRVIARIEQQNPPQRSAGAMVAARPR